MKKCNSCNVENPFDAEFCSKCGMKLTSTMICINPQCRQEIEDVAKFCSFCRTIQTDTSSYLKEPDVYVAGYEKNNQEIRVATLWKNGIAQRLTDGSKSSYASNVYVWENNVYVAGFKINVQGMYVPAMWKNGIMQSHFISEGFSYDAFNKGSFITEDNILYKAGYEKNKQGKCVAVLWKNRIAQSLTDGKNHASAIAVYVSGNDVYVAGYEHNLKGKSVAMLWKNGIAQKLTDGNNHAEDHSVFVK